MTPRRDAPELHLSSPEPVGRRRGGPSSSIRGTSRPGPLSAVRASCFAGAISSVSRRHHGGHRRAGAGQRGICPRRSTGAISRSRRRAGSSSSPAWTPGSFRPEALGLEEGDAHVIRNAGGRARDSLRSIIISQRLLGTREVAIIHHTDCGMLTFTNRDLQGEGARRIWARTPASSTSCRSRTWTRASGRTSSSCRRRSCSTRTR